MWVQQPPAEYVKSYEPLVVFEVPAKEIKQKCGVGKIACSLKLGGTCFMWVPSDADSDTRIKLFIHELGHCNGWRHDDGVR